jgi:DNA-binding response OmpR family regulator
MVTHRNRVLWRADVLEHVWHNENDDSSRTIDVHIRRLRMKLGMAGNQIQTVPRIGYRFSED